MIVCEQEAFGVRTQPRVRSAPVNSRCLVSSYSTVITALADPGPARALPWRGQPAIIHADLPDQLPPARTPSVTLQLYASEGHLVTKPYLESTSSARHERGSVS